MGQSHRFRAGQKAPNNGVYIEIGETGNVSGIQDPKQIKLKAGDRFPENTNDDRQWTYAPKTR
jgi:hypothetical protein